MDKAFEYLGELLATPNFNEPNNISDLIKMGSVQKANEIGNKALDYAFSYSQANIKAFGRSFEKLRGDVFFCQYAAEMLKTSKPQVFIADAILKMTDIASFALTQKTIEVAIHGSSRKFPKTEMKLEVLFNHMKNENSRFTLEPRLIDLTAENGAFTQPVYDKNFFKTPLSVNNCTESLQSIDFRHDDYGALLVASSLISNEFLLKSIREKGGAYGAGCRANESGVFSFYSFRDPKVE